MPTEESPCPPAPPAGLRIVRATTDDAETLAELIHELARFEKLDHACRMTPEFAQLHLLGAARSADVLLAWLEEAPVGFAVYYRTYSTFAARPGVFLEDLYVRERFRHRGIGRALLGAVGRIAHHAGAGRFEWTALKWNENARRLYSSLGAREMDEWVLLRMETPALAEFATSTCHCAGHASPAHAGCNCGSKGSPHAKSAGCHC